jgi:hypothetical protein
MADIDPPKDAFELGIREYELAVKAQAFEEYKFREENRSILRRLPVVITAIAGASAILFQGLGTWGVAIERSAQAQRAERDFDFKGLELFINRRGELVSCNPEVMQKNLDAFTLVLSERVKPALDSLVEGGVRNCAADAQTLASTAAPATVGSGTAQDQTAYYGALQRQAGVLAATAASGSGNEGYRVFLQYQDPADLGRAASVRAKLQADRYSAPGIQRVSVAPSRHEVRYYRDEDAAAAAKVAKLVADTLKLGSVPATVSLQKLYPNLPGRSIEVWFPAPAQRSAPASAEVALYVGDFPTCREARSYAMRVDAPLFGGMRIWAVPTPTGTYGAYVLGNPPYTRDAVAGGCDAFQPTCRIVAPPTRNVIERC